MPLLPTLHGVPQTDYDMDGQASMALLGIVQFLYPLSVQLQEADVTRKSSPPSCQTKWRLD